MPDQHEHNLIAGARAQVERAGQGPAGESGTASVPPAGASSAVPSDSIAGYTILRELHRGGQGVVYQALQKSTKRKVAIKVLREGPFASASDKARFEREVEVLGKLRHPNIVTVHDSGSSTGQYYLVMDYIPGLSLDVVMASGEWSIKRTLELFEKICDAVNAAHLRGVIHRDLKPRNIQVDEHGEPHVLDFGLAKVPVSGDAQAMTLTGQFVGSMPWSAPEQVQGTPDKIDVRTDVYALGVILYQMLTKRFPYEVVGSLGDAFQRIVNQDPVRPRSIRKDIDDEVETIVLKCLAKQPERRYQSAGELSRDLRHYLNGEPIEAKRDSGWYVLRKSIHRYRLMIAAATVFVLLITIFGVISTALYLREGAQRRLAEQRAAQIETVASFQASMLQDLQAETVGRSMIEEILSDLESAWTRQGRSSGDVQREVSNLRSSLSLSNPTTVAVEVFDKHLLNSALLKIPQEFPDQPTVQASLLQTVADVYGRLGLLGKALEVQQTALELRRRELGDDDAKTIESLMRSGVLLKQSARYEEAERVFHEATERATKALGPEHSITLSAINNLGLLCYAVSRYDEAEKLLRRAFETRRRVLGDKHPQTLASCNNLGYCLDRMGRKEEAEQFLRTAVEGQRIVLGNDDPDTLSSISNLAALLQQTGRVTEALPLYQETLERRRRVLGDDHPDTLVSINNMGFLLQSMGKLDDAEEFYREGYDRSCLVLGKTHPRTACALNNLGLVLKKKGALAEAESCYRDALAIQRRALGNEHANTLNAINNLGTLLRKCGRLMEAEALLREAVAGRRKVLGENHSQTITAIANLAYLLKTVKRFEESEALYLEFYAKQKSLSGQDHPRTIEAARGLGYVIWQRGRIAEAEAYVRSAAEKACESQGHAHPACIRNTGELAYFLHLTERWGEAESLYRRTIELNRRAGADVSRTCSSMSRLCDFLIDRGRYEDARQAAGEYTAILEEAQKTDDWRFQEARGVVGAALAGMGRYGEAEQLLLGVHERLQAFPEATDRAARVREQIVELYEQWATADPQGSYHEKAAAWRSAAGEP